jgi:NAD(P)H-hydrate epimerase
MNKKKYALSRSEMYDCDRRTMQDFGLSSQVLMENAARSCADIINNIIIDNQAKSKEFQTLIICGDGNNGGDGFVIARWLNQYNWQVKILFTGNTDKMSQETNINYNLCRKLDIPISTETNSEIFNNNFYLIIDAVYGIGFKGQLPETIKSIFKIINEIDCLKISIDIASGLNADTGEIDQDTFKADYTLTMAQAKLGHYLDKGAEISGKIFVVDIGIPRIIYDKVSPKIQLFNECDILLPKRFKHSHKGNYGRLGIIAGSPSLTGAAILSAKTALHCGAGLITLYHHPNLETIMECSLIEIMTKAIHQNDQNTLDEILTKDTLLIGPGLGKSEWAYNIIRHILLNYTRTLVIDADALNLISENPDLFEILKEKSNQQNQNIVITPHLTEFSRLLQHNINNKYTVQYINNHPIDAINEFLTQINVTILLKNHYCLCSNKTTNYLISGGNDGLSTGGTGDVLAGMIASFIVQNIQSKLNPANKLSNDILLSEPDINNIIIRTVSTSVKYLYQTTEHLNKFYLTPAITPSLLIKNLFNIRS